MSLKVSRLVDEPAIFPQNPAIIRPLLGALQNAANRKGLWRFLFCGECLAILARSSIGLSIKNELLTQRSRRMGVGSLRNLIGITFGDDLAAACAAIGAEVDHPVCLRDHL